jgi:hypothetical protein
MVNNPASGKLGSITIIGSTLAKAKPFNAPALALISKTVLDATLKSILPAKLGG